MIEQDNLSTVSVENNTTVIESDVTSIDKNHKILELRDDGQDNTLYQADVMDTNTIYEIRHQFDLKGATLEIPINSVLYFENGGFQNGIVKGNDTMIIGYNTATLENIIFKGTFITDAFKINENGNDEIFVPNNLSISWKSTASEPGLSYPYYKDIKGDYKRLSEITSMDILDVDDIRNKIDGYSVFANDKDHRCPIWYDETDDTWRYADGIKTEVNRYGTTEQRPKNIPIGFEYFDTTLNSPIWNNGATWVYPIGEGGGGGSTGSFTAEAQAVSLSSTTPASANVTLEQGTFKFKFGIPAGKDGKNGLDAIGGRVIFAYKAYNLQPATPTGGGVDMETNTIVYPEGWGNIPEDTTLPIWMSSAIVDTYGTAGKWTTPIRLTGKDGANGQDGQDGIDAVGGRLIFAFKSSSEKPERPTGGVWNLDTNIVTPPDGWENDSSDLEPPVWMSNCLFGSNGLPTSSWSDPIKISGEDGTNGTDGSNTQFIYKLTVSDSAVPTKPTDKPSDDYSAPAGWTNHPSGISEEYRAEWMCISMKPIDGAWGDWQGPYLWSNYGVNGMDGDGIKYAFKRTNKAVNPGQPSGTGESVEAPEGWTDEPTGVDSTYQWEWVTISKYNGQTKTWSQWSMPTLWSKYGENGYDGNSLEVRYALTDGTDDVPPVVQDNRNPGSIWQTTMPHREDRTKAIWGTQALINANNELVSEWSEAYLITGVDGANGNPVNYKTYVYKLSDTKPNKPTGNDPANPGDGWIDYPNTTGQWWQCIGLVNGKTELVESWGEVIPLNGKDGTAQDGKFTEFRFAKSTNDLAPSISRSLRNPGENWTLQPPSIDITRGESLWLTSAIINPDDTLNENWAFPVRISGEQGPKGDTGPAGPQGVAGSQGVSGIPGKFIEVRFCLGTDSSYDGTSSPGSTREPSGWSLSTPKVTEEKPYIWFIQATIKYANNDDTEGYVNGSWSTPAMLSGKNGLDGLPGVDGRRGQIIYPAGIYDINTIYETTEDKAPYVYDSNDGNFYVLNTIMQWKGTEQSNRYPNQVPNTWTKFDGFEAVYTKIGIIANGLIGSAVFNGDYMFSQQGGGTTGNFEDFNPDDPVNSNNEFIPNLCINFKTGEVWFGSGSTHLAKDGSGYFSNGDFKWNDTLCVIGSDSKKGLEFNYSTNEYKLFDGQMIYKDDRITFGDKVIIKLPNPSTATIMQTSSQGLAWTATTDLIEQGYRTFIAFGSTEEGLSDKIMLPRFSSAEHAGIKVGEAITFINASRNYDNVAFPLPETVTILNYGGDSEYSKIKPLSHRRFIYMGQSYDSQMSYWGDEFGGIVSTTGR